MNLMTRMMKQRSLPLMLLAFTVVALGAAFIAGRLYSYNQAPALVLVSLNNEKIDLLSLRGRPVLITFWATDCASCITEIPHLAALHHKYHRQGLVILGITLFYDPPIRVAAAVKQHAIPYPVILDLDRKIVRAFKLQHVLTPTSLLIAPSGEIVLHKIGVLDQVALERQLDSWQHLPAHSTL